MSLATASLGAVGERIGRPVGVAFVVAAASGLVHAGFSLYWAVGGDWLLDTLGERLSEHARTASGRVVLGGAALVKAFVALGPLLLARRGWPLPRVTRPVAWLSAALLTLWGAANTVVGQLVLAGAIRPDGGYDRPGMVGHAWLWDPLFLVWGVLLGVGLWRSRHEVARRLRA